MSRFDSTLARTKPFVRKITKDKFSRRAAYAVHGFWSGDNVHVSQSVRLDDLTKWGEPSVNWSTGGADNEQEPDRIFAAECFAAAIKSAAKLALRWKGEQGV